MLHAQVDHVSKNRKYEKKKGVEWRCNGGVGTHHSPFHLAELVRAGFFSGFRQAEIRQFRV